MKKLFIFLIVLATASTSKAQKKAAVSDGIRKDSYYLAPSSNARLGIGFNLDSSTKWVDFNNVLPNQPLNNYIFLYGTKKVLINVYMHEQEDPKNYRYNIIQDDSIYLVTNAILNGGKSYNTSSNNSAQINLGVFDVQNKKLTIETYNIQRNKVSTTTFYNKPIKPAKILMTSLWTTSKNGSGVTMENLKDGFSLKINDGNETVNGIQLAIKQTDLTFIYHVFIKNIASGKMLPVSNNWLYGGFINNGLAVPNLQIDASFFSEPGDYEIVIIPQLPSFNKPKAFIGKATTMRFTVLKSDTVYSVTFILLLALGIIILAGIVIYFNKRWHKNQFIKQQQEKDLAQVQLGAVRSQLNPHFLFNALAGIQNLMNKNEVDQANRYLTKFARLTRNVLNSDELISITDETALLDDYLQMEQLRFGFTYHIETGKDVGADTNEIPSMLLQPFVENAVKHGIADLGTDGKIDIRITKQQNDLVLSITDNGSGFDTNKSTEGLGIPLSKKRIALWNTIYKHSPVLLDIRSGPTGTEIKLTLTQWI